MQNLMKNYALPLLATVGLSITPLLSPMPAIAQRLVELNPAMNSQNAAPGTSISGQFDAGNGPSVEVNSVQILVNNQDVTSRSTITRNFFSYRPDLPFPPGPVRVKVQYRNTNNDLRTLDWTFTVQQPQALQITSITHDAIAAPRQTGATFRVTLNGTPGAQASILLIQDRRTIREIPAPEVSSGVYVGTLTVQRSDRVDEGIVVGRLRRQNQSTYAAAAEPFTFNANNNASNNTIPSAQIERPSSIAVTSAPLKPIFTRPRSGEQVGTNGFTLVGQTSPGARVQVNVDSKVSVFGVDLGGLGSEALVNQEVLADNRGEFRVEVPKPRLPLPGMEYTIRATARLGGETSDIAELILR
jgi:hypothetical protein